jgi:hypothetical protein
MIERWRALLTIVLVGIAVSAPAGAADTTLRLTVPRSVAAQAARRAAGDAAAPSLLLMLEGARIAPDEGLDITVLGPPASPGGPSTILAVTGTVGSSPAAPTLAPQRVTLPVPLNDEAAKLLADRTEVTLTLRVAGPPGRPPLTFDRAYFREP